MTAGVATPDGVQTTVQEAEFISRIARRKRRRVVQIWFWRLAILVVVLGAWQLSCGHLFPAFIISSPSAVVAQFWHWLKDGYLLSNLGITMEETAIGFFSGIVVGSAAGILLGRSKTLSDVASPYINILYAVPKIMLAPLLVVWFGIELEMKAVLSASFVVFIVFYNIWSGVREVDQDLIDVFLLMGAKRRALVTGLYIPSALSWLFVSLRLAFPVSLIGAIVGEFIASSNGVGYVVTYAASQYDAAGVFVGIIAVTIVAVIADTLIVHIQRVVSRRHGREGGRLVI